MLRSLVGSEMCIRDRAVDLLLNSMLELNPESTEQALRVGLEFNANGTLGQWDLAQCNLVCLPESFGAVRIDGNLDLRSNSLRSLPETFGAIRVGGDLHLRGNQLSWLPKTVMETLQVGGDLDLQNNQLSTLPEVMNVRVGGDLYLSGNPLSTPPNKLPHLRGLTIFVSELTASGVAIDS
eukprot:TRINITY_DN13718_c0_g1_i1.p1 TRINITY_DN13718_c0_g1~~TRINITY_DN13718_c0_g1_i1.p1  ORF type:complete len:198 (-),score=57.08 TRINITY_DN13718_c0_g1_i1:130-669(-)